MATLKALSVRQPWAHLIVSGNKDIENRVWTTKHRGLVLIHASASMTDDEYKEAADASLKAGVDVPSAERLKLELGGIVGYAEIVGVTSADTSPWFVGPYGFKLANARPLPFTPMKGKLSLWPVDLKDVNGAEVLANRT